MPTFWMDVHDLQPPFDLGILDGNSRAVWCFNVQVDKYPSATLMQEVVAVLVAAGIGTFNTDIFASTKSDLPTGAGPYITISATGGLPGVRTHNITSGPTYERPTVMITVRASSSTAAEAKARAAYAALMAVKNQAVTAA